MPDDAAVRTRPGSHIFEDLLHLYYVAFKTRDLGDTGNLALAVRKPRQLHDDADGRSDLPSN